MASSLLSLIRGSLIRKVYRRKGYERQIVKDHRLLRAPAFGLCRIRERGAEASCGRHFHRQLRNFVAKHHDRALDSVGKEYKAAGKIADYLMVNNVTNGDATEQANIIRDFSLRASTSFC